MNALFFVLHLLTIVGTLVLGFAVYFANRRRASNQLFLACSLAFFAWLVWMALGFTLADPRIVAASVRSCNAIGLFIVAFFHCLARSFSHPEDSWLQTVWRERVWMFGSILLGLLCLTKFFLADVVIPRDLPIPRPAEPVYGPGILIYGAFLTTSLGFLVFRFIANIRKSSGVQRTLHEFGLLALGGATVVGTVSTVVLPVVTGTSRSVILAPMSGLIMYGMMAYGIVTRSIIEVPHVLRLVTAYSLLGVYLALVYTVVLFAARPLLAALPGGGVTLSHAVAAFVMAFQLAPAHGYMQRFANRLFMSRPATDVALTVQSVGEALQLIGTLDALLKHFSGVVSNAVGTDRLTILLGRDGSFVQAFPPALEAARLSLAGNDPLVEVIRSRPDPLCSYMIQRLPPSPLLERAGNRMGSLNAHAAVGVRTRGVLGGIMLFGPRLSGRVYGRDEQRALQIAADQLGVALENSKLYTEVQNGKIYMEILLDSLVSGVVASTVDRVITVFNREAQRITRLNPADVIGRPIDVLPAPLVRCFDETFKSGGGARNQDLVISHGKTDETPVQVGSSVFRGHEGNVLGVLLVVSDISIVKRLETQIRRTVHLASLGTLSAGMAHEIKNPLVTLKTFAQLLPENYDDAEFRTHFSGLIDKEVNRIDAIVTGLLRFGRPPKATLKPISVHDVLNQSIQLISIPLRKKGVALQTDLAAPRDTIEGDANLLEQAFVNFFLNAIDATATGGSLAVSTGVLGTAHGPSAVPGEDQSGPHIRVSIRDTGEGIAAENIPHVFDPFFTTKETGTGLGLSVTHGIIREHKGVIDVDSTPGVGTTFHVLLPLRAEDLPV